MILNEVGGPGLGPLLFCEQLETWSVVMVGEPRLDETQLLAAVDGLKRVSVDQREAAIAALDEEHPGVGDRVRAMLAREAEYQAAIIKKSNEVFAKAEAKPSVAKVGPRVTRWRQLPSGAWEYLLEGQSFWRRHFGIPPKHVGTVAKPVVQLKVVDQAKPEPEPEPEEPKKKAAVAPVKNEVAVVKVAPLGFQHSKNPIGIPASLENAIKAIDKLGAECRYDVFHDRIIVKATNAGLEAMHMRTWKMSR